METCLSLLLYKLTRAYTDLTWHTSGLVELQWNLRPGIALAKVNGVSSFKPVAYMLICSNSKNTEVIKRKALLPNKSVEEILYLYKP